MPPVVGFDFDECLTQAYTLVPFILILEAALPRALSTASQSSRVLLEKSREAFYTRIAMNEVETKGTLFRPSMLVLIPKLLNLRSKGLIQSLFLYSNNGMRSLIDAVDHILALTLKREPFNVPEDQLIKDADGRLHVLSPRAHIDEPCRTIETKEANGFREKTFEGIQSCLGMSLIPDQVWYFDDTIMHEKLMSSIKGHYTVVKPYNIKIANKRLSELFADIFTVSMFDPDTREGKILLAATQKVLPGFHPTGRESDKIFLDKLTKELRKFSPLGAGRPVRPWNAAETSKDLGILEAGVRDVLSLARTPVNEPALAFSNPVGGSRKTRKLRKNRKV